MIKVLLMTYLSFSFVYARAKLFHASKFWKDKYIYKDLLSSLLRNNLS